MHVTYPETSLTRELCPSCLSRWRTILQKTQAIESKTLKTRLKKSIDLVHGIFDIFGDTSSRILSKYVLGTRRTKIIHRKVRGQTLCSRLISRTRFFSTFGILSEKYVCSPSELPPDIILLNRHTTHNVQHDIIE